ncbi:MAG: hypothetical protein HWN66_19325 [Candidatus Helarchaeota archaeon]|nr:hypothetical protein [Candidatus Helarchaeota archaeon]
MREIFFDGEVRKQKKREIDETEQYKRITKQKFEPKDTQEKEADNEQQKNLEQAETKGIEDERCGEPPEYLNMNEKSFKKGDLAIEVKSIEEGENKSIEQIFEDVNKEIREERDQTLEEIIKKLKAGEKTLTAEENDLIYKIKRDLSGFRKAGLELDEEWQHLDTFMNTLDTEFEKFKQAENITSEEKGEEAKNFDDGEFIPVEKLREFVDSIEPGIKHDIFETILEEIESNQFTSYIQIAKSLDISNPAVYYWIKKPSNEEQLTNLIRTYEQKRLEFLNQNPQRWFELNKRFRMDTEMGKGLNLQLRSLMEKYSTQIDKEINQGLRITYDFKDWLRKNPSIEAAEKQPLLEYSDYYTKAIERAIEGYVLFSDKTLAAISGSIREDFGFSVGPKTVARIAKGFLLDENYQKRFNPEGPGKNLLKYTRKARKILPEQIPEIIIKYNNGASTFKLGKEYNVSPPTINRHLRKHGVQIRKYENTNTVANGVRSNQYSLNNSHPLSRNSSL